MAYPWNNRIFILILGLFSENVEKKRIERNIQEDVVKLKSRRGVLLPEKF